MAENVIIANRYELIRELGEGGIGSVHEAFDRTRQRRVAVKLLGSDLPNNVEFCRRFELEAKALAAVKHPNVIEVLEAGADAETGMPFMVMEFVEGTQLDHLIAAAGGVPLALKLSYSRQLCDALQALHDGGMVHRNVKPANVLVRSDQSIKLLDSGIARIMGAEAVTKSNIAIGTLFYMSPEQVKGEPVDGRSDIFSTGIVLYQLMTGKVPWTRDTEWKVFSEIIGKPFPPLSTHLLEYPKELDGILERALAKDREQRYQNAREMSSALAAVENTCALRSAQPA